VNWPLIWALWFCLPVAAFVYLETRAVHDPKVGDTLTEVTRAFLHTRERTPKGRLGRVIFLVLMVAFPAWFCVHILVPGFV
jgi:hypothetical protein